MTTKTVQEIFSALADLQVRREPGWWVASRVVVPPSNAFDVWSWLQPSGVGLGPGARLVKAGRRREARAEVPASHLGRATRDRRLHRRLLPRSPDEPRPDPPSVAAAFAALPGNLDAPESGVWSFRPALAELGPLSVRGEPGGAVIAAKLGDRHDASDASRRAVGEFLWRVQSQLRMARIMIDDADILLEGWLDAECLAEDAALTVDALSHVAPRLRRSLAALACAETAAAYLGRDCEPAQV